MRRNDWRDGDGGGAVQRTRGDGGGEEVLGGCGGASAGEGGARKFGNEGTGRERADAGVLRRALAHLCRAGQDAGDAWPWLATTWHAGSTSVGH